MTSEDFYFCSSKALLTHSNDSGVYLTHEIIDPPQKINETVAVDLLLPANGKLEYIIQTRGVSSLDAFARHFNPFSYYLLLPVE
jgi:hypothetical protein